MPFDAKFSLIRLIELYGGLSMVRQPQLLKNRDVLEMNGRLV